jgi:hypothetical protein
MRNLLIILWFFIPIEVFSQIETTSKVISVGDSILNATIGSKYQKYFKLDSSSTYEFKRKIGNSKIKPLQVNKRIRGIFESADLVYRIEYPNLQMFSSKLDVSIYKSGYIYVNIEDIPDFILKNREFEYISFSRVKEMADSLLNKHGIRVDYMLHRDYESKIFVWEINNIIRDHTPHGNMDGLMEIIKMEPKTENILEHKVVETGHLF